MTGRGTPRSAGLLLYRFLAGGAEPPGAEGAGVEVLIVHPGGPFWARKDLGAWSIPKGLVDGADGEPGRASDLVAARREFAEETGTPAPDGPALELGEVRLASRKVVVGFAIEGDLDTDQIQSNTFETIWPPRSGRTQTFPEIDRALWCSPERAVELLNPAQAEFIPRLLAQLEADR